MNRNFPDIVNAINKRGRNRYYQGIIQLKHPEKYIGIGNPEYKSSYEARVMNYLDLNDNVVRWGYEIAKIPYHFALDGKSSTKTHNYFTDIYCEVKDKDGKIRKCILEIKPKSSVEKIPQKPSNSTKKAMRNYIYEMTTYVKNQNKWDAARKFCEAKGWEFIIVTEDDIMRM